MIQLIYNCIYFAIIWVLIGESSFFCSKFTVIAKYDWFTNSVIALEGFAYRTLKSEKLGNWIFNFSYNKIFMCRPCHSFWLSLPMFYLAFESNKPFFTGIMAFLASLLVYYTAKEAMQKQRELNAQKSN